MYGLEKGDKDFEFDLEKEILKSPKKGEKIIAKTQKNIHNIKTALRNGSDKGEIDKLGVLLQGYIELEKVINKIIKT